MNPAFRLDRNMLLLWFAAFSQALILFVRTQTRSLVVKTKQVR